MKLRGEAAPPWLGFGSLIFISNFSPLTDVKLLQKEIIFEQITRRRKSTSKNWYYFGTDRPKGGATHGNLQRSGYMFCPA